MHDAPRQIIDQPSGTPVALTAVTSADLAVADIATSGEAALALENERLKLELCSRTSELHNSRLRLVEAADAERIRLERNLHDGAQQHLLSIALKLRLARDKMHDGHHETAALLEEAMADITEAAEELRELARGVHPTILTDRGLAAAIEALADRTPINVILAELPAGRLPAQVESTAYFIAAEAIANVMRHSAAKRVVLRVVTSNRATTVEINDNGIGGADMTTGTGLTGLADRAATLDGSLTVLSPAGEGTLVRATLNWPRPALAAVPVAMHA